MRSLWAVLIVLLSLNVVAAQEKPPRITPANFDQLTQIAASEPSPTLHELSWLDNSTLVMPVPSEVRFYDVTTDTIRSVPIQLEGSSIVFNADASRVVTFAYLRSLTLWDGKTGAKLKTIELNTWDMWQIYQIIFIPNTSDFLSINQNGEIHYWKWAELIAGTVVSQKWRPLTVAYGSKRIAMSRLGQDATIIAIRDDVGMLRVWQTKDLTDIGNDEKAVWTAQFDRNWSADLAFSPDGKRLIATYGKSRTEWDSGTGEVLRQTEYPAEANYSVMWNPDGTQLLSHYSNYILHRSEDRLVDLDHPEQAVSLPNYYGPGAFSPDGKYLVYVDWNGRIHLRNLVTSEEKFLPNTYGWEYNSAEFDSTGSLMLIRYRTYSNKYGTVLWNLNTLTQRAVLHEPVMFVPGGGSVVVGNDGGVVSILDGFTLLETRRFSTGYNSPITVLAFSPGGQQLAAGDSDGHITVWDMINGVSQTITTEHEYDRQIGGLWFSPDGNSLASWNGGASIVEVWDMSTLEPRFKSGGLMNFGMVSFSPDSRYLLVGGIKMLGASHSGVAHIHDLQTGQELAELGGVYMFGELPDVKRDRSNAIHNPHWTFVDEARWFVDSDALLTISWDAIRVWDLPTIFEYGIGVKISQVEGVDEQIYGFSPPGAGRMTEGGRRGGVGEVVFSPTEPLLVFWDNQDEIQFWDISDLRHIQVDKLPDDNRYSFVFSPDGNFLLGLSSNQDYQIWDAHTRQAQSVAVPALSALKDKPQDSWIRSFQFTPDGTRLIVLCGDAVRILQVQ